MKRLLLLLVITLPSLNSAGEPPPTSTTVESTRPNFDMAVSQLPARYEGESIEALVSLLRTTPKGEFETTPQYQQRMESVDRSLRRTWAFKQDPFGYRLTYDADAQVFTFRVEEELEAWDGVEKVENHHLISLASNYSNLGTYTGQNAFGATREVTSADVLRVGVAWGQREARSDRPMRTYDTLISYAIKVPVPLAEALSLKSRLRLLFVVEPTEDEKVFLEGSEYKSATIDSPTQRHATLLYLVVKAVQVWVYDYDTGQILTRYHPVPDDGFSDNGDGTVTDTRSGLMWAERDNGSDITWDDAKRYCENYRGGGYSDWRMPTIVELQALHDESKEGANRFHITRSISLTECCPWSSEPEGAPRARGFAFDSGLVFTCPRSASYKSRALPVRSLK